MNCIRRMTLGRKARSWGRFDIVSYKHLGQWPQLDTIDFIMPRSISAWTRYDEYAHSFKIGHGNTLCWDADTSFTNWVMRP